MKKRTKAFADVLLKDATKSAAQAYVETHEQNDKRIARHNASALLKKPEVQLYMKEHVDKATKRVVELVGSQNEMVALKASESIIDREHGKPLTRNNNLNIHVSIEEALSQLI